MGLSAIDSASAILSQVGQASAPAPGNGFSRILTGVLKDAGSQQIEAEKAIQGLALGQADSLHGVLLKMAQADLSFSFVLEVRNRLLSAYQEVMQMTV